MSARGISARAKIARLGLRWFVKKRGHHQTLAAARKSARSMESLIPHPPRDVVTEALQIGQLRGYMITTPSSLQDRSILFLHGGGYRLYGASTYRHFTWRIAQAARARLLAIDYRLAPEHAFPAALEDALSGYDWLVANGSPPHRIGIVGDSSGGGLALALLLKLRDDGKMLPASAAVLSPWTDLALTGASLTANAAADPMLNADDLPEFAADYLAGADPRDPYASPLYGDPSGLPPTLIQVGSDEILRDDAVRMAEKMRRAKCPVELEIWPCMPHAWHLLAPALPEAVSAIAKIGLFLEKYFASPAGAGQRPPVAGELR